MIEFSEIEIGKLGKTLTGKTPLAEHPDDFGDEYLFVTPSDSLDQKFVTKTERKLSQDGLNRLTSKSLPPYSILVSCIGSAMGKVAMNRTQCVTNQQFNCLVPDANAHSADCIYYSLKNSYKMLRRAAAGSTALPILNKTDFDLLCLRIPKKKTDQIKIASVLSSLDARIELNNQINAELEAMAKLLYDYWFVQFDFPMTAAQAAFLGRPALKGKPYKSSGGKMVHNPTLNRQIPEGWSHSTLGEIFNLYQPQTISGKDLDPSGHYFVYGANGIVGRYGQYNHEEQQVALTCRGSTCGNLTRTLPFSWITGNAMVMSPRAKYWDIEMTYNLARMAGIHSIITGSGQPQITRANLEGVKCVMADKHTIESYCAFSAPITLQRIALEKQNQELTQLRDWLLPMLMNGQVTVGK